MCRSAARCAAACGNARCGRAGRACGGMRMAEPSGMQGCVRARWTTAMTGMFEAYPVEESRAARWIGWSLAARVFPRTPSLTRCTHGAAALAADASEHGGRIFYRGVDFRSKSAERQHDNSMFANRFFLLQANFEHILLASDANFLYLYFCVRLRFPIRHCLKKQTNSCGPNACWVIAVTSTAVARLCFSYHADSPPPRAERI
jgi:hypothetical protein